MLYVLLTLTIIAVLWLMAVYIGYVKFITDTRDLALRHAQKPVEWFSHDMLESLPSPVRKYLAQAIPEGFPFVHHVQLRHKGKFRMKPGRDWMPLRGEQYFSTDTPGFIWRGITRTFTAIDRFVDDKGSLKVKLFSVIPVISLSGAQIDEGELQRWIGEQFWFPTNFLNQNLFCWEPIDDRSSRLTLRYENHVIPMEFIFNEAGLIDHVTCCRYKDKGVKFKWTGHCADYRHFHGLYIPTRVRATWHLPEGEFTYADFEIISVRYDPSPKLSYRRPEVSLAQAGSM